MVTSTRGEPRAVTAPLHQSSLVVTDLDASTAFYRDVVGLSPDAVDAVHRRAEEASADVRMEPRDVGWGRRVAIRSDSGRGP